MVKIFAPKTPVKYKSQRIGVVTKNYKDGTIGFVWFTGSKSHFDLAQPEELEIISQEELKDYIENHKGQSLLSYLWTNT